MNINERMKGRHVMNDYLNLNLFLWYRWCVEYTSQDRRHPSVFRKEIIRSKRKTAINMRFDRGQSDRCRSTLKRSIYFISMILDGPENATVLRRSKNWILTSQITRRVQHRWRHIPSWFHHCNLLDCLASNIIPRQIDLIWWGQWYIRQF